ncbi:MAG: hypothetical protein GX992_04805 [Clostridium sp.]|nr:hypothetical protein [Clostridium sp.]
MFSFLTKIRFDIKEIRIQITDIAMLEKDDPLNTGNCRADNLSRETSELYDNQL